MALVTKDVRGTVEPVGRVTTIGGASPQTMQVIAGLDPVLQRTEAVVGEIKDMAQQIRLANDRATAMLGQAQTDQKALVATIQKAVTETTAAVVQELQPLIKTATTTAVDEVKKSVRRGGELVAAGEALGGGRGGRSMHEISKDLGGGVAPTARVPTHMRAPGEYGIADLRQHVAGWFAHHAQENAGPILVRERAMGPATAEGETPWAYRLPSGQLASDADIEQFRGRSKVSRVIQATSERLAGGQQGVLGSLAGGVEAGLGIEGLAERAVPVLGLAYAATKLGSRIANFSAGERAQNAQFQAIEGGTNAAGFAERARMRQFAFGQRYGLSSFFGGGLSGRDAEQLFMGVTGAFGGDQGGLRENALNFAVKNYRQLGMSIQDSVQIIQTASKTGQDSLTGVADALDGVTKAAKSAGVNTDAARKSFISNWQAMSGVFGEGAVGLARGATEQAVGLGRAYAANLDVSGVYGEQQLRMIGARMGLGYNQVSALSQTGAGRVRLAQGAQGLIEQTVSPFVSSQQGQSILQQFVTTNKPLGPNGRLSQSQLEQLGTQLMKTPGAIGDIPTLRRVLAQVPGVNVGAMSDEEVAGFAEAATHGQFDLGAQAKQEQANAAIRTGRSDVTIAKNIGAHGDVTGGGWGMFGTQSGLGRARGAYLKWGTKLAGGESPIIDALLRDPSKFNQAKRIEVQTGQGPRQVNLVDAIHYYADQLAAGTATVTEGAGAGKTVAQIAGIEGAEGVKVTSDTRQTHLGAAVKTPGGGGVAGKITVSPSPELRRWFQFNTSGDVSVDPLSPPPSNVSPFSMPTGTPGMGQ